VVVLRAEANGALQVASVHGVDLDLRSLGIADADGDGNDDIIFAGMNPTYNTGIYPGRSDGTFGPPRHGQPLGSNLNGRSLPAGDWDGDGNIDLVLPWGYVHGVGDGTFGPFHSFDTNWTYGDALPVDLDRDGNLDIILARNVAQVLFGTGDGGVSDVMVLAGWYSSQVFVSDINGDGALDVLAAGDHVAVYLNRGSGGIFFLRGDCNDDGGVNISDAICILGWLFLGEEEPACVAVTNANGDEGADLSDAVYLLRYLFLGSPPPVEPFPDCGPMPDDEELACETPPVSCHTRR
jgi:hypothetical protein